MTVTVTDQTYALEAAAGLSSKVELHLRAVLAAQAKAYTELAARFAIIPPVIPTPLPTTALKPGAHNDTELDYGLTWVVGANVSLYQGNDHYSNEPGSTASFKFSGTGFRLFAAKDAPHGIVAVTVDDRPSVDVDLYAVPRRDAMVYELLNIPDGVHTVVLAHTGRKNPEAANTFVLIDKVDVLAGTNTPWPLPPVVVVPAPPVVVPLGTMPTLATVGVPAGTALTKLAGTSIVAGQTYSNVEVVGNVEIGTGQPPTSFITSRVNGAILSGSPINLDRSQWSGGMYIENTGGRIQRCLGLGKNAAFRPATPEGQWYTGPMPFYMSDTYLKIPQGVSPAHTEACQMIGGVGGRFQNVVFDTGGPFNNTQTADLSYVGKDLLCEDCWFIGFGGYAIYCNGPNNRIVRPHFARTHPFGLYYPSTGGRIAPIVTDARYMDGTPV